VVEKTRRKETNENLEKLLRRIISGEAVNKAGEK
jgi:hypothetical protein